MAPATWQDVYATIAERNAVEQDQKTRALLGRKRALSPVNWSVTDSAASHLAALPSLRKLVLTNTEIGDGGLQTLSDLPIDFTPPQLACVGPT